MKKIKKAFTLVELVVVIAVIAILSAVSVVTYIGVTNNARERAADSDASSIKTALLVKLEEGDWSTQSTAADDHYFTFTLATEKVINYKETGTPVESESLEGACKELVVAAGGSSEKLSVVGGKLILTYNEKISREIIEFVALSN